MLTKLVSKKYSTTVESKVKQITYYPATISSFSVFPQIIVEGVEMIDKNKTR